MSQQNKTITIGSKRNNDHEDSNAQWHNTRPDISPVINKILENLDIENDRQQRIQFNKWLNEVKLNAKSTKPEDILFTAQSFEVLEAMAKLAAKEILLESELNKKNILQAELSLKVNKYEEIDPDWDWKIKLGLGSESKQFQIDLVKSDRTKKAEANSRLFRLSGQLANAEEAELERIRDGDFSDEFEEIFAILGDCEQDVRDLAEMLLESDEEGRKLVRKIIIYKLAAERIESDMDKPRPLRILAQMAIKELGE